MPNKIYSGPYYGFFVKIGFKAWTRVIRGVLNVPLEIEVTSRGFCEFDRSQGSLLSGNKGDAIVS